MPKKKKPDKRSYALIAAIFTFCGYFKDQEKRKDSARLKEILRNTPMDYDWDDWYYPRKIDILDCFFHCKHYKYLRKERREFISLPEELLIPSVSRREDCSACIKPNDFDKTRKNEWKLKVKNCYNLAKSTLSPFYRKLERRKLINCISLVDDRNRGIRSKVDIIYLTRKAFKRSHRIHWLRHVKQEVKLEAQIFRAHGGPLAGVIPSLEDKASIIAYVQKAKEESNIVAEIEEFVLRTIGEDFE
ncbi:MAG: hypothetical protein ACXAEU_25535 [Candidatus Hodarchaeales archaeon]|jgi:hypothetical protein